MRVKRLSAPWLGLLLLACGSDPEEMLMGRWQEVEWRYDKFDGYGPTGGKWVDGFRFPEYSQREVVRHEAESWEFKPGRLLEISLRSGETVQSRWRLKGRGHVLTIRHPNSENVELYDVKQLTSDTLVLNFDIGMEVRGIARLKFRKLSDGEDSAVSAGSESRALRPSHSALAKRRGDSV